MAKKSTTTTESLTQTLVFDTEKKHSWLMRAEESDTRPIVTSLYLMKDRVPTRPSQVVIAMKVV